MDDDYESWLRPAIRLIIAGSRTINDFKLLIKTIEESGFCENYHIVEVVCGGASGVDALGKRWAKDNNIPVRDCPANWNDLSAQDALIKISGGRKYDARAGFRRNQHMADIADALLVITNGSSGSEDMIKRATKKKLVTFIKRI